MRDLPQPAGRFRVHPDHVQRNRASDACHEIGANSTASPRQVIDHDQPTRQFAAVTDVSRVWHAVLNHLGRRVTVVPHEAVVVRDVHELHGRIIDDMARIRRIIRRVMFEIHFRQPALLRSEELELIFEVSRSGLKQNAVKGQAFQLRNRHILHPLGPGKSRRSAAVSWAIEPNRQEPVMRSMGEVKEVIPMHVPGQNPQRPVGCIHPRRFNGRPAAEEIVNLSSVRPEGRSALPPAPDAESYREDSISEDQNRLKE